MVDACRFFLGVSSSIFPAKTISSPAYKLLAHYGVAAVEIGYEKVGPALLDTSLQDKLVALVRDAHPPVVSLHAPYEPDRDISVLDEKQRLTAVRNTEKTLELADRLGANIVVVHGSQYPIAVGEREARRKQAHKSLDSLVEKGRALNLRLALEMMPPEWLPAGTSEAFDMVEGLDPNVIGFCLDTNHANLTGDLSEIVHALGSRIWIMHLSDNDGLKQQHWMPFQGVIDWEAFMAALVAVNYAGPLHYELDPHPSGPEKGLQEIEANFQRLLGFVPGGKVVDRPPQPLR